MSPVFIQVILVTVAWASMTYALWRARRWLLFYVFAVLGLIVDALFVATTLGWDAWLASLEARQVAVLAAPLGLALSVTGGNGLAIPNHAGWAVFAIGVECSALLEIAAIVGLTAFYPAFSRRRKALTVAAGAAATYVMNLMRIMLIVALVNFLGTSWVFAAHAVFGRVFFFVATVGLFWWLVTRPTLGIVGRKVLEPQDG